MKQSVSVVDLVNTLIHGAIACNASDIHLEMLKHCLRVRFRIDGILYDKECIDPSIMEHVLSCIKVMAHIDIAEKRIPHDGKFKIIVDEHEVDLRVSSFPSIYGEKIVIRILDRAHQMIALDKLGFEPEMLLIFKSLLNRSSGFFLVSGPTGSGKTTTLYASLAALCVAEKNIVTLEDPVEYSLDGIVQSQIHIEAGFTFERGLRSLLRQDPDIVMIGEIRDRQTAQIAIEAALTGHVVLSTIHTNDAPTVIMRLIEMGIEPFLVNAAISGVMAQRLARTICKSCKIAVNPTIDEAEALARLGVAPMTLYRGQGCSACFGLGYKGRVGLFELLIMTPRMRELVMKRPHYDVIADQALSDGMKTLLADGLEKVRQGVITLHELVRVVF